LEKLASLDKDMFKNLGNVISVEKKKINRKKLIEKKYDKDKDGSYALGRFLTDGTYGYIILAHSISDDFLIVAPIMASFRTDVPYLKNVKNRLSGKENKSASQIVEYLIMAIILFAIPVAFGLIGFFTSDSTIGLYLCIGLPLLLSILGIFLLHITWWTSLIISIIICAIMFAGRIGLFLWFKPE
jgi:hypothetical protein